MNRTNSDRHGQHGRTTADGAEYKGMTCRQVCSAWDSHDRDCDIIGDIHPPPSRCRIFLEMIADRRLDKKN